jgi:anti-sigma factor RsiW
MLSLACLVSRSRLDRYVDGALKPSAARSVKAHLGRCRGCLHRVEQIVQLEALVRSTQPDPPEPDWSGFWTGIQARVLREKPRPLRDPWWLPLWKPLWGHPRLAMAGATTATLAALLLLWPLPGREGQLPMAWAGEVLVQDVGTSDPEGTVMVYSAPDQDLTVIWLFPSEVPSGES